MSLTNLLHDVLIRLTIERRHTGQEDVCDDTCGPDITFLIIILVQNFRRNIIGCSELLVEVTVGVIDERGTEIDDLDLIEFLVLLKKNVLGLKITMDDVGLMTVVDARENLLHENGTVALSEFTALKDLIEEFTALANSIIFE